MTGEKLKQFIILPNEQIVEALKKVDANKKGFLVVVDDAFRVMATLTDGDIRRGLIRGVSLSDRVDKVCTNNPSMVRSSDELAAAAEYFKKARIKFLPVINDRGELTNIITKKQFHAALLQDIHADLSYDFDGMDEDVIDYEIFFRPWGFYKTTVLNDFYQSKTISVKPQGVLSLQSHNHREEYWIVVHGNGIAQLGGSEIPLTCGRTLFIPKGCKHRLYNTDEKETLIITEVQLGDYLGEDDIIRYEDIYGRV